MGEPFRNYDAVLGAARRIMKDLGIGARHITISTVGVVPNIRRFADECAATGLEISLAISLHEATDEKRSKIMPVNRRYDIDELLDACRYYVKQSGRRISFEWALIAGQNDDARSARELAQKLRGLKCHVNLIPLNPTKGFDGQPTPLPRAEEFISVLAKSGIPATVRVRRGIDIDAGCGQVRRAAYRTRDPLARAAVPRSCSSDAPLPPSLVCPPIPPHPPTHSSRTWPRRRRRRSGWPPSLRPRWRPRSGRRCV
jgi:23S rRNA (adenine2503-C2)-methyltransferase